MSSRPLLESPEGPIGAPEGGQGSVLGRIVYSIARAMERGEIGQSDAANLRRLAGGDPASPAYWKVMVRYVMPHWHFPASGHLSNEIERRWAVILHALAYLSGLHERGEPLGAVLADAGMSELRFVRLLRARDGALADAVRKTARFLASKGRAANLADLAELVLSEGRGDDEAVRRRIARSYYQQNSNN